MSVWTWPPVPDQLLAAPREYGLQLTGGRGGAGAGGPVGAAEAKGSQAAPLAAERERGKGTAVACVAAAAAGRRLSSHATADYGPHPTH